MKHKLPQLFLIFSALFFLSSLWYSRYRRLRVTPPEVPREIHFSAVLEEEPYVVGQSQYFEFNQIRVRARSFPRFHYGDALKITGTLTPELRMDFPKIEKQEVTPTRYVSFIKRLYQLRDFLDRPIIQSLPEPQASLLSGILLGTKRGLAPEFAQKLRDTGTIHVVVVSGYNITVIGGVLASLTRFLGRKKSLLGSLVGIFLFTLMVGAEPPVIRAALMGSLVMLGKFLGRPTAALKVLALSAVVMLFIDPLMINDLGFQLSFLATFGLLVLEPELSSRFKFKIWGLEDSLWSTIAAQVMVLPVLGHHFERVSIGAPLPNVLILWIIPPLMVFGSLLIGASLLIRLVVPLISAIVWVLLTYFVLVIEVFSRIRFLTIDLPISGFGVAVYYLVLFVGWRKVRAARGLDPG